MRAANPDYPHYFLGSMSSARKKVSATSDGQQRLTSLTLLLVLLRNPGHAEKVNVDELSFEKYGQKSFNLHR
jgi:uncharacterized protein with ParB-like and HNH nuclease domain